MTEEKGKFLNHSSVRTQEQKDLMARIEKDGVCPFCIEHFKKYHPKPIIKETDYWFFTENISPYEGSKFHFIFVYKPEHITSPSKISTDAQKDLFDLVSWATDVYKIEGGSFFMRFGNTSYTGSSVEHIHAHLVSGVSKKEASEAIRTKLAWKK
ncbi:MAG: hypothetical protein DRI98_11135 [Bacteroidetes bacterium]|nr:MAG: hypothetical protein DRI98_11135 [Bacteroidota bacterium]